jgi:hypothetical protein
MQFTPFVVCRTLPAIDEPYQVATTPYDMVKTSQNTTNPMRNATNVAIVRRTLRMGERLARVIDQIDPKSPKANGPRTRMIIAKPLAS